MSGYVTYMRRIRTGPFRIRYFLQGKIPIHKCKVANIYAFIHSVWCIILRVRSYSMYTVCTAYTMQILYMILRIWHACVLTVYSVYIPGLLRTTIHYDSTRIKYINNTAFNVWLYIQWCSMSFTHTLLNYSNTHVTCTNSCTFLVSLLCFVRCLPYNIYWLRKGIHVWCTTGTSI